MGNHASTSKQRSTSGEAELHGQALQNFTRPPSSAFLPPFLAEGSPTKLDYSKKIGHPYSNLSNLVDLVHVDLIQKLSGRKGLAMAGSRSSRKKYPADSGYHWRDQTG